MVRPVQIEANALYDDSALKQSLGLYPTAIAKARKRGELRFTKRGGRILYLGRWVQAWLTESSAMEDVPA